MIQGEISGQDHKGVAATGEGDPSGKTPTHKAFPKWLTDQNADSRRKNEICQHLMTSYGCLFWQELWILFCGQSSALVFWCFPKSPERQRLHQPRNILSS
jgi:hypothetical protein